jgi:isoquinoline 1-oxidoreductase subunit alpha
MLQVTVNGTRHAIGSDADTPLLWVLRDELRLTGTKFGCGIGACGACTVMVNGEAVRSCSIPIQSTNHAEIVTIEGLAAMAGGTSRLSAVQSAWISHQIPQCGYCQPGMIMAVTALLAKKPSPTDADIDAAITNICRCGTYPRVRRAVRALAGT